MKTLTQHPEEKCRSGGVVVYGVLSLYKIKVTSRHRRAWRTGWALMR